jgi:hypothetical protein
MPARTHFNDQTRRSYVRQRPEAITNCRVASALCNCTSLHHYRRAASRLVRRTNLLSCLGDRARECRLKKPFGRAHVSGELDTSLLEHQTLAAAVPRDHTRVRNFVERDTRESQPIRERPIPIRIPNASSANAMRVDPSIPFFTVPKRTIRETLPRQLSPTFAPDPLSLPRLMRLR